MLIRDKDKEILLQIFSSSKFPFEVWAYGSRVNGDAHEGSDLDLVIRSENMKPIPFEILNSFRDEIRESRIPILVELRDWAVLPESFHKNIEQKYEVIFENQNVMNLKESSAGINVSLKKRACICTTASLHLAAEVNFEISFIFF